MKKKIIIFGATGNVGSYLLKYALEYFNPADYEIIASGRRKTDFFTKRGISYYSVDITRKEDFTILPTDGVYAVILLSGILPAYMKGYEPQLYIDSIITGGYNVLEYCRLNHVDRILYSQTVFDFSAYPHDTLLKADAQPKYKYTGDHAMYVIAKNAMLDMMEHYYQQYGLKKFVFRFPSIYSYNPDPYYYQDGVKTKRPLWIMIEKAQKGEPIEIWGDGKYAKDMVHVYDCSQMFCRAVEANLDHGIYNVGTGHPVTMEEQVRTIVDVFSPAYHRSEISYLPEKVCWGGFLMDISNAVSDLGYQPQYDCRRLFEDFKQEMQVQRFRELRCPSTEEPIRTGGGKINVLIFPCEANDINLCEGLSIEEADNEFAHNEFYYIGGCQNIGIVFRRRKNRYNCPIVRRRSHSSWGAESQCPGTLFISISRIC